MPAQSSSEPAPQANRPIVAIPANGTSLLPTRIRPAVLGTTPNLAGLLQALRRRWLLALILGVVCSSLVVAALLVFQKNTFTSRTLLHVSSVPQHILQPEGRATDFNNYQRTQIALIKSKLVLGAALNDPKVAELETVKQKIDTAVAWLEKEIMVDFNTAPEILRIAMNGEDPDELKLFVNAVREAYLTEIVNKEFDLRKQRLKTLNDIYDKLNTRIQAQKTNNANRAKALGSTNSKTLAMMQEMAMTQLHSVQNDLIKVQAELAKGKIELKLSELKLTDKNQVSKIPDSLIEAAIKQHPSFRSKLQALTKLEDEIQDWKLKRPDLDPNEKWFTNKVQDLELQKKALATLREKLEPQIVEELQDQALAQAHISQEALKQRVEMWKDYEESLKEEIGRRMKELENFKTENYNVEVAKEDMAKDEKFAEKIGNQIGALEIERQAPVRVEKLEDAIVVKDLDSRIRICGLAGAGVFALVVFGVALLEFRQRRVNTVDDVVRGLDMRLMGTLPTLPTRARRRLASGTDPNDLYWESLLTESVDAARTMLLHAAKSESHQVVMVSSAVGGEGKTLLSCHLAVSLARAGFRTLLVDCDLRRPSVHKLFKIDASPGSSDVLRGEIDMVTAAQPGPIDGLWIVPAGVVDGAAYQAMAQHRFKEIFQGLKSQFDFILVDSAPVLPVADSLLIAQCVDSVVFSILRDVSRLPTVYAAYERLAALRVPILGAVVNGAQGDHYNSLSDYVYRNRTMVEPVEMNQQQAQENPTD